MEFLKNHKQITNQENKKLKEFAIKTFQNYKSEGRSPEYAIENTRSLIWENFIEPNFINKYSSHFESFYTLFWRSFDNYDSNADVPYLVLKNEIFNKYRETDLKKKLNNRQYDEDFDNLTFEGFVSCLLKYDAAKKTESLLLRNSQLYKLFYTNDYYEEFTFEKFDGHIVNSDLYRKTYSKFNPNSTIPVAIKKINNWNNETYEIDQTPILSKEEQNLVIKEQLQKPNFELDEKLLLLHYCLVDKYGIPLTERAKLTCLLGPFDGTDLFEKSSDNSNSYKKISSGYERKGSSINTRIIIENIINKLDSKIYKITIQTLKKHSYKLKSEENQ
ncbi:hypothetical protein ACFS5J_04035 [Flavobacterium chuncheonense]|uniref:Uncharacterized protein n=1 Tax=Flavobacterium chuncheonense TaxID=2026653 RepID=A0ABW5YJD8_9FLAO